MVDMNDPDDTGTRELRSESALCSHASRMWRFTVRFWKTRSFWVFVGLVFILFLWEMDYVYEGKLYEAMRLVYGCVTKHPFIMFASGGVAYHFLRPKIGYFDERRK